MKTFPHDPRYQRFIELLKEARSESGMTQNELARLLNRPQSYISKYESGERKLDPIEVLDICGGLGVSFTDFCKNLDRNLKSVGKATKRAKSK